MIHKTTSDKEALRRIFERSIQIQEDYNYDLVIQIVDYYRQIAKSTINDVDLSDLIETLTNNVSYLSHFKLKMHDIVHKKDFDQIISDSGIINYSDFLFEVKKRSIEKILPYQPPKETLEFALNQIFYRPNDPDWLARIPKEQISTLFKLCEFTPIYEHESDKYYVHEILYGLEVLTQRVSGRAMEADVSKMVPEYRNFDSPFIGLLHEMNIFIQQIRESDQKFVSSSDISLKQLNIILQQCEKYVDTAFNNSHKYGISIKVNQSLLRIRQQLSRIKKILPFVVLDNPEDAEKRSVELAFGLIFINCNKANISKLFNESTQLIAYEITQHSAQTGEHYITSTQKEYFQMLWSACLGGFIVAFLCIFKVLLGKVDTSIFGHAFLYSLNYSLGFIVIYLLGATLATKQPAMTAAALVAALQRKTDSKEGANYKYWMFANFFSQVFRSQFIAFVGNVFFAFPIAMLLIWGIDVVFDYNIAETKWRSLITDLDPIDSPAIMHAAIAGVFLFLSGIIAGSIANRDKHNSVYYRIQEHPILKKVFGKQKTEKISNVYKKKWAGIISNLWFGVFMGTVGSIGIFLGLDLDIRHITFASGNLALGMYGNDFRVPTDMIIWGIIGIGVIGFVNFIVSFSLSLILAFRARNLNVMELVLVTKAIWALFIVSPYQFFFPPKTKEKREVD